MQNPVEGRKFTINFMWIFFLILAFLLIKECSFRNSSSITKNIDGESHTVTCISEVGDTVAVFKTKDKPSSWTGYDGLSVFRFYDEDTGKLVEVRTKTGTIIWQ